VGWGGWTREKSWFEFRQRNDVPLMFCTASRRNLGRSSWEVNSLSADAKMSYRLRNPQTN